jgi:hypothetical protein
MKPSTGGLQGLIEKAAPTLAATAGARRPSSCRRRYLIASCETPCGVSILELTYDSVPAISKAVRIPTMAASGISYLTAPLALASGAAGVGVGSAINKLNSDIAMVGALFPGRAPAIVSG